MRAHPEVAWWVPAHGRLAFIPPSLSKERASVMPQSKNLFATKVGEGGQRVGRAVADLHDLIAAAGIAYAPERRDRWQAETLSVLKAFRQACIDSGTARFEDRLRGELDKKCIDPSDATAFNLAYTAKILIEMPRACGIGGVQRLNEWFGKNSILYQMGAEKGEGNRATYALEGFPDWAVQSVDRRWQAGPVRMDCTTYVNLAMGVYFSGEARGKYDAATPYGGKSTNKIANRYDFHAIERPSLDLKRGRSVPADLTTAADLQDVVNDTNEQGLYIVERARMDGFVTHMALLHRGTIWEFNTMNPVNGTQFFSRPVERFAPPVRKPQYKYFIYAHMGNSG